MTLARRRILWMVLNPLVLAGVAWSGYFQGPKAVANLIVFYSWFFLITGVVIYTAMRILKWTLSSDPAEGYKVDPVKRAEWALKKDELVAGIGTMELSVPRWLDRIFDFTMIATMAGAGWLVTAFVYLGGYLLQRGTLKMMDEVRVLHEERMEEALGVKL